MTFKSYMKFCVVVFCFYCSVGLVITDDAKNVNNSNTIIALNK